MVSKREPVNPLTFDSIQNVDIDQLSTLSEADIRPILPCLVRMSLCAPLDDSEKWTRERKKILKCLSGIEVVNSLVGLLSIDFRVLETDSRKEAKLRTKAGSGATESMLVSQLENGLALEFEKSDAARKLRLLLSEYLFTQKQVKDQKPGEFYHKVSELFESQVYLEEVSDVLCIAQAELPSLMLVPEIADTLLHVENGVWLMARVVANVPDSLEDVVLTLVRDAEKLDEDNLGIQKRTEALLTLCRMCPSYRLTVRDLCVEHCKLPGLALALTLEHHKETKKLSTRPMISDVVAFVSGLLLGSDNNVKSWFAQYIRSGQKKKSYSYLQQLREELLIQLKSIVPKHPGDEVSEAQVVQGCAFIKMYCAMKGLATMRFNEDESKVLLELIMSRPPRTASGVRFVSLSLCMLLACPYLLSNQEQEKREEKKTIEWIKWLVREGASFESDIEPYRSSVEKHICEGSSGSFGEMLLLIAIHFHSNQNNAIADLVSTTLGMKSAVKANSLARIKTMFTQEIFTEQVVTSHAVKVSVTENLNAKIAGFLPVHCIYQLLKSRAFSKHKVPIKEWILQQIKTCTTPLHPTMPQLIHVYINSILLPSNKTDRANEPITEREILDVFKDSAIVKHFRRRERRLSMLWEPMETDDTRAADDKINKMTSQILLLYYVLLYQDVSINNARGIANSQRKVHNYSQQFMSQLPIKYLLQQTHREQHLYTELYSSLLRLVATHYPHLCLVEDWLDEEILSTQLCTTLVTLPSAEECNVHNLGIALSEANSKPTRALLLLEKLRSLPPSEMLQFAEVLTENLLCLLDPQVPRKVKELAKVAWIKLNTVMPRKIRVMTVNSLRSKMHGAYKTTPYTEDDLTVDPLIVLRCDERVFRCAPILEIVLRILEGFMQASRAYLSSYVKDNQPAILERGPVAQEKEDLKNALVSAQESAIVQVLLECCLPMEQDQKTHEGLLCDLREIQCLICSRLHQFFIADPTLVKLVHFQGYPSELLPVTVAGIPSMHICLDFIPELIGQPHQEKQIFAIELISYLSLQFSLPKSMGVAKLAVNVMATMLTVLPASTRPDYFLPLLPALVRISKAFPPLCQDIVSFLIQLGRVCNTRITNVGQISLSESDPIAEFPKDGVLHRKGLKGSPLTEMSKYTYLATQIQRTFGQIVSSTAMLKSQTEQ